MDKQDELIGKLVLVHPELPNDPENRKNMIGTIVSADLERDDIMVSFEKGRPGLFSTDALLVLRDPGEMQRDADTDRDAMPWWEYKEIEEIIELVVYQDIGMNETALRIAQESSPDTLMYTLESLRSALGLARKQAFSR